MAIVCNGRSVAPIRLPVMALIEMTDVGKSYVMGEFELAVLRDVTLTIKANEYVAVVGSSGSGKSTLMNIIGCLDHASSGHYRLNGEDTARLDDGELARVRNRQIGFVFQNFSLMPRATALRNVMQPLVYRGVPLGQRLNAASSALSRVGLADRMQHLPGQLSGGQRQRVAVARALVTRPAILLADEPTGNLDRRATERIMALFDELHESGQTLIVVTHEADIAARSQRIVELADGRLVGQA